MKDFELQFISVMLLQRTRFFTMCKEKCNEQYSVSSTVYFPNGKPVHEVLTEEEAINFLRLDLTGVKNPHLTLRYYREHNQLRGTRIGKKIFYTRQECLQFLARQTEWTNRKTG